MSTTVRVLLTLALIPFALLGIAVLIAFGGPIPIVMGLIGGSIVLIVKYIRKSTKKDPAVKGYGE
jgi:hypothetical protein